MKQNSKYEKLTSKQLQIFEIQNSKQFWTSELRILDLFRISILEFRN